MIKYVFFDLDETLIDIKKAQNEAIKSLFYKFHFNNKTNLEDFTKKWDELTEYHYKFYTSKQISYEEQRIRRITDLFNSFEIGLSKSALEIYDIYLVDFENAWGVFDDVFDTLKELKNQGFKLGLLSNGDYSQQVQKMKYVGIFEFFDYVNTSSEFEYSKPDPRVFEKVFNLYNIDFSEVIYVGDSYKSDISPCKKLGIKSILINRKKQKFEDIDIIQTNTLSSICNLITNFKEN